MRKEWVGVGGLWLVWTRAKAQPPVQFWYYSNSGLEQAAAPLSEGTTERTRARAPRPKLSSGPRAAIWQAQVHFLVSPTTGTAPVKASSSLWCSHTPDHYHTTCLRHLFSSPGAEGLVRCVDCSGCLGGRTEVEQREGTEAVEPVERLGFHPMRACFSCCSCHHDSGVYDDCSAPVPPGSGFPSSSERLGMGNTAKRAQ